ncbi:MAG TPA: haloalkane dehalogenase, partial [Alphaproteobacteria bacterium]|nr:haloalkane dehalogenase [Alphaproteobacteria bacterium]
ASNTGLPEGKGESEFMKMWVGMMRNATTFPLANLLPQGMTHQLTPGELASYLAPFPSDAYMAGIISFPMLIAVQPENPGVPLNKKAWETLERFDRPFLTLFGELDPVAKGADVEMQTRIPGAKGQPHARIPNANHFIQEDAPERLVEGILDLI